MRISDWSSDVCSSDLIEANAPGSRGPRRSIFRSDKRLYRWQFDLGAPRRGLQSYVREPRRVHVSVRRSGKDRKSVVKGKSVSGRVDLGGRRIIKKKKYNIKVETRP